PQAPLVVEYVGTQPWIDREQVVEHRPDAAAGNVLHRAGKIPLQIGRECDAGHDEVPCVPGDQAAAFAGPPESAYSVFTGVTLRRMSRTGQWRSTVAFSRSMSSVLAGLSIVTVAWMSRRPGRTPSSTAKNPRRSSRPVSFTDTALRGMPRVSA